MLMLSSLGTLSADSGDGKGGPLHPASCSAILHATTLDTEEVTDLQPVYSAQAEGQEPSQIYAAEVLRLTNVARAQQGLEPLQYHAALTIAAVAHTQEMLDLDYFSHSSPTPGRKGPMERVALAGVHPRWVAENIFQCSGYEPETVAQFALENWLESPGHRANLLSTKATHLGVGFVEKNGTIAVTQVFGAGL